MEVDKPYRAYTTSTKRYEGIKGQLWSVYYCCVDLNLFYDKVKFSSYSVA